MGVAEGPGDPRAPEGAPRHACLWCVEPGAMTHHTLEKCQQNIIAESSAGRMLE